MVDLFNTAITTLKPFY